MIKVNIFEAKAKLSKYLDDLQRGEEVIICKRNSPIAELRLIAPVRTAPRPIGGAKSRFAVPPSFFDPLPEEIVDSFHAADAGGGGQTMRVAGRKERDRSSAHRLNTPRRRRS
jgi:antitoxin (DNA-binding transcriptional repressor) of toxin-antitoxin stability system